MENQWSSQPYTLLWYLSGLCQRMSQENGNGQALHVGILIWWFVKPVNIVVALGNALMSSFCTFYWQRLVVHFLWNCCNMLTTTKLFNQFKVKLGNFYLKTYNCDPCILNRALVFFTWWHEKETQQLHQNQRCVYPLFVIPVPLTRSKSRHAKNMAQYKVIGII